MPRHMTTRVFVHIVNGLKKWLSRLTRSSTRLLFFFLSLLRRSLAAKLGDQTVPKFQGDIAQENLSIYSSLLPSELDATAEHLSPSDDPYTGASRPLRRGTTVPSSGNNATIEAHTGTAETNGVHIDSISISPLVADEIRQYGGLRYQTGPEPSKTTVPAMTFKFPVHDAPPGWIMLVHPGGFRYFVNQENRTFTQMDIFDEGICADIEYFMQHLLDGLRQIVGEGSLELDIQQVDLVLEPKVVDGDSVDCCYYFANHCDRSLFWLNERSIEEFSDRKGMNISHIGIAIQAQYWKHYDLFPYLCPVTQNLVDEVKDMLIYATCDHLSSQQSTAPFNVVELRDYLSIMDRIKVHPPTTDRSMQQSHAAIVIGQIMYAFSRNHFINFHGVRMTSVQTYKPSTLMAVLAPFLFLDPMAFIRELHISFIDNMPTSERWDALNLVVNGQLQDSNLLATVLLNANVGFLAINSVDVSGRSPIQVASYMSLVASLGSMILGLLFVSHTRTIGQSTVHQKIIFLSGISNKERKLERLAIVYSLPRTLLIWGMIFFFVAFSINWWSPGNEDSRAVVGSVILITVLIISYGVVHIRNREDRWRKTNPLGAGVRVGLEPSSHIAGAWKNVTDFMGMRMRRGRSDPTSEPQSDTEGIAMAPMGTSAHPSQATAEADAPMPSTSNPPT